jgi:isopenicillin N synthase-like dioxygenase
MRDLALNVLRGVLQKLDLPPDIWDEATGRAVSGAGTYHLTFNHFRSDLRARGLNVHKDSGWVTVLRSIEPGLEVLRGDRWLPITPIPDHFIINFGCAMEILTRRTQTPVAAVAHRVHEVAARPTGMPHRFSYALFVDSSLDEKVCPGLLRYERDHGLALEVSFKTFLKQILDNTYQADSVGLYERRNELEHEKKHEI